MMVKFTIIKQTSILIFADFKAQQESNIDISLNLETEKQIEK